MPSFREQVYAKYRTHGLRSLLFEATGQVISNIYTQLNVLLFLPLAHALAKRLPKKSGLVVFYNSLGYKGNSRHIYEWFSKNQTENVNPVWLTNTFSLYIQLRLRRMPVAHLYSPWGMYYFARASVFCYDNRGEFEFPDSSERFQMRHEVPVKYSVDAENSEPSVSDIPVAPPDDESEQTQSKIVQQRNSKKVPSYNHVLYPSEFLAAGEEDPTVNIVPYGFPRNDKLIHVSQRVTNQWNEFIGDQEYDLVILYAPTSRKKKYDQQLELFPFEDFEIDQFVSILEELNALLLIRLHPYNNTTPCITPTRHKYQTLQEFIDTLTASDRVRIAGKYQFGNTTEILPFIDVLITDYSAVYHTFLQLDRPIVFFPYDYDSFKRHSGFKYDYFRYLPGPDIDSFTEFSEYLCGVAEGRDPHKDQRTRLRNRLYDYDDAKSRARVASYISQLANN